MFFSVQVEIIKDKAREFAALPPNTLASLKKQCSQPVADSTKTDTTNSTVLPSPQQKLTDASVVSNEVTETLQQETCAGACVSFLPTKCAALEMEGSTPLSGVSTCRNVPCSQGLSAKSDKIWNNNNNIETSSTFVTTLSNGNGVVDTHQDGYLSNTDCVVPESDYSLHNNSASKFVPHYSSNLHSNTVSVAPYSEQKLLQSAVELIDSGPCLTRSSTCPKPAFVDPSKPGQVLQVRGGSSDMAAASSASSNTKKAELKGVRLTSTVKSSPLPNGSINNKKLGVSTLQKAAATSSSSSNSLPNDSTPLMGNSQRTDSSVCVKQYGTNVPSNRHDHLQSSAASCSVDSDEPQDKSKLAVSSGESDGTIGNKPTTLGEQFEASKAQEGKKKKSKKKKKNKGEFGNYVTKVGII